MRVAPTCWGERERWEGQHSTLNRPPAFYYVNEKFQWCYISIIKLNLSLFIQFSVKITEITIQRTRDKTFWKYFSLFKAEVAGGVISAVTGQQECWCSSRAVATKMHNKLMLSSIKCNLNPTEIINIICGRKSDQFRGKIWIKLPVFISRHQEDMAQRLMMGRLLYRTENCNEIDTLNRRFFFLSVTSLSLVKLSALERFLWRTWMISLIIQLIHFVFNFNP